MDNQLLTPLQLWTNYQPNSNLKLNLFNYNDLDTYCNYEAYFDGDIYDSGATRIYAKISRPHDFDQKVLIVINDHKQTLPIQLKEQYLDLGYCVIEYDYTGYIQSKERYTSYPKEVEYANLQLAGSHLYEATPSAKHTCVYVWTKVCRSIIAFASTLFGKNCDIHLMGIKKGCDILWQAAMDEKVKSIVSVINGNWADFSCISKQGEIQDHSEERSRWLTACAPQSYIKFITCPILFIACSNSQTTNVDSIENSLKLAQSKNIFCHICCGLSNSIDSGSIKLIYNWYSMSAKEFSEYCMPTIKISIQENIATALVEFESSDVVDISVNYCFDEAYPSFRNWKINRISLANPKSEIDMSGYNLITAYATITFKDGSCLSSYPCTLESPIDDDNNTAKKFNHIIYQRKLGVTGWFVEGDSYFESACAIMKSGELDIPGVSTEKGNLTTYSISDTSKHCEVTNILHFDVFDNQDNDFTVKLTCYSNGMISKYYATANCLKGCWTTVSLQLQDFKNKEFVPLKSWSGVKKLTFINPKGAIFNNIIWV